MSALLRLKVWWRRHLSYRLTWLISLALLISLSVWVAERLQPRLMGLSPRLYSPMRQPIRLRLSERFEREQALHERATLLRTARYGVPVLQAHPSLRLIGTVEEVSTQQGHLVAQLGIYPHDFKALTSAAQFRLLSEPPSLSLLFEDLQSSPRGRVAMRRLREAISEAKGQVSALLSTLLRDLREALPSDLLTRLSQDPLVIERVERHLSEQVIDQLPWGALLDSTLESEEFEAIRSAALKGIKLRPILAEALKGVSQHALKSRSVFRGFKFTEPLKSTRRLGQKIKEKKDRSLDAGAQKATDRVLSEIRRNIERDQEQLKHVGGKLLARQAHEAHLEVYVIKWAEAIVHDEVLLAHLKERYQPALIRGAQEGLRRFKERPEVSALLSESWEKLSRAGLAFAQALIFDHKHTDPGPNPLFIAVVEELLRGEQSPRVYLTPHPGERVQIGHLFEERPPPMNMSWLARLLDLSNELEP